MISPTDPGAPGRAAFVRHRGPVTCVAGIPGTHAAVTSGYDGAVGYVDLDRQRLELLGYHGHLVNRIVVDARGSRAASVSSDYDVYVWDLARRRLVQVLRGHADDVEDFVFVGDGAGVSVSRDRRILVWNLRTGAITRVIEGHDKDVLSVAHDRGVIFTSGDDMTLRQWDLATGEQLKVIGPFEQETDTCAVDPVHGRIVLGCDDGVLRVFDLAGGEVARIEGHSMAIKKVAISPAGGHVLSAGYDQRIRIWDATTLEHRVDLERALTTWERSLNWSPDGAEILAGTFDGTVVTWDARTGARLGEAGERREDEGNPCFNEGCASGDAEIALVSDDGHVRLARLAPGEAEITTTIAPARGRVLMNAVVVDERAGLVVTGAHDHHVHIFRKVGRELRDEIDVDLGEGPVNSLRVARAPGFEGQIFAGCYGGAVVRLSPGGVVLGKSHLHEGAVKALRLHPGRPVGVSCGADNRLLSWSLDGTRLRRFPGHNAIVDDVDIAPDGTRIASVSRDFTLKVFDLFDGTLHASIAIGRRSPKAVCFLDAETVIVSDYWGALLRVDLIHERLTRHPIAVNGISSLCRIGAHLAATSYDGAVYLVRPGDMTVVATLRAMTQRLEPSILARAPLTAGSELA